MFIIQSRAVQRFGAVAHVSMFQILNKIKNGRRFSSLGGFQSVKSPTNVHVQHVQPDWHALEKIAQSRPRDATFQNQFYRKLNDAGHYDIVIKRIDTNIFAANDVTRREYQQARQATQVSVGVPNAQSFTSQPQSFQPNYNGNDNSGNVLDNTVNTSDAISSAKSAMDKFMAKNPSGQGTYASPIIMKALPPNGPFSKFLFLISVFLLAGIFIFPDQAKKAVPSLTLMPSASSKIPVERPTQRFTDVKGCPEAKVELEEIVEFLKSPSRFERLGGKMPKGVMLMGPPGTGKTLLAKAIAGEAEVPFFYASGSEFEEMFVGVGAKRIRELFAAAKLQAPAIIFIDEIDAIGGSRKMKEQQSNRMTLNQLLVELDGFNTNSKVIVIGATNFPQMLDKALLRPGRFDRHVQVPLPDVEGRTEIIEHYLLSVPTTPEVSTVTLARGTPGSSGADLFNMVNMAAVKASMDGKKAVSMLDLEYCKDKVLMGTERKSAAVSAASRKLTAYHEGGHALVAFHTASADPIHKATIIPRGQSLGMVYRLPSDEFSKTKKQLLADLDVAMGGRVAEQIIFGDENITTGASSDIEKATGIAREMVLRWGMSPSVGVIYRSNEDFAALSADTKQNIDLEIKTIIDASYNRAESLLSSHAPELHNLAQALLDYETLEGHELAGAIRGEKINKPLGDSKAAKRAAGITSSGTVSTPETSAKPAKQLVA